MTEFKTQLIKFNDNAVWSYHLDVPDDVARAYVDGTNRRVICTLNGKESVQCALMGKGGSWFINVNKKLRDKLGLVIGQEILVRIEKDKSEYGMDMSEELEELLDQDEEGKALFLALTMGKRRSLIYWAKQVKSPDKRLTRALVMLEHLKRNSGELDFRMMLDDLKAANNRF